MPSLGFGDLILDLLVTLFFSVLFMIAVIKIHRIRKRNFFSKSYYLFVGSFLSWTLALSHYLDQVLMGAVMTVTACAFDIGYEIVPFLSIIHVILLINDVANLSRRKAIITIALMAVPSMNDCKAATIFAGVNASAVMEMCKYGSYMGLILIWGDLFLLSFEQTPTPKRDTPKPIINLLIIFITLIIFLFLVLFGTNIAYYFAYEDYCESHNAQSTLHVLFAVSYCFVYLSTVVITLGFWKYLSSLFQSLLAERQSLKQNSAFHKTLLKLACISLFCLVSFVLKSFFILGSLFIENTYYAAVFVITVLECSCGALLLYGATLEVPIQETDPHQPLLPSAK